MKCGSCGKDMEAVDSTLGQSYGSLEAILYECPATENMDGVSHYRRWDRVRKPASGEGSGASSGAAELRRAE